MGEDDYDDDCCIEGVNERLRDLVGASCAVDACWAALSKEIELLSPHALCAMRATGGLLFLLRHIQREISLTALDTEELVRRAHANLPDDEDEELSEPKPCAI
jgi:hypothetical protein